MSKIPYYPALDHVLVRFYARKLLLEKNAPTARINEILKIMDLDFMRKDEEAALRMGTSPKEFGEETATQLSYDEEAKLLFRAALSPAPFLVDINQVPVNISVEPQITIDDRKFLDDLKVSWEKK